MNWTKWEAIPFGGGRMYGTARRGLRRRRAYFHRRDSAKAQAYRREHRLPNGTLIHLHVRASLCGKPFGRRERREVYTLSHSGYYLGHVERIDGGPWRVYFGPSQNQIGSEARRCDAKRLVERAEDVERRRLGL